MTAAELSQRRKALALTQEQFAERLGVARSTIARWETGAMKIEQPTILELALRWLELQVKSK